MKSNAINQWNSLKNKLGTNQNVLFWFLNLKSNKQKNCYRSVRIKSGTSIIIFFKNVN